MEDNKQDIRYFIVYFSGVDKDGELRRGKVHMFTENGGYVNEEFIHKVAKRDFHLNKIYVSQVKELNEKDFTDFTAPCEEDENNDTINDDNINQSKSDLGDYI